MTEAPGRITRKGDDLSTAAHREDRLLKFFVNAIPSDEEFDLEFVIGNSKNEQVYVYLKKSEVKELLVDPLSFESPEHFSEKTTSTHAYGRVFNLEEYTPRQPKSPEAYEDTETYISFDFCEYPTTFNRGVDISIGEQDFDGAEIQLPPFQTKPLLDALKKRMYSTSNFDKACKLADGVYVSSDGAQRSFTENFA